MIKKIISGGLPGVELAALHAAIKLDIPHEGWTYKRRKTENNVLPEKFNVREIVNQSYLGRLEKNIASSDGTVILTYGQLIRGSKAIKEIADKRNKPYLLFDLNECTHGHVVSSIRKWMDNHKLEKIFFTGSKPIASPNLHEEVIKIIEGVCQVEREYQKHLRFNEKDYPDKF